MRQILFTRNCPGDGAHKMGDSQFKEWAAVTGHTPRLTFDSFTSWNTEAEWKTTTSISAGHTILTPIQRERTVRARLEPMTFWREVVRSTNWANPWISLHRHAYRYREDCWMSTMFNLSTHRVSSNYIMYLISKLSVVLAWLIIRRKSSWEIKKMLTFDRW